jgi:hypothetical protein
MKAQKVSVEIKIESLDIAVLRGMLFNVIDQIEKEATSGELLMSDGDLIKWSTTHTAVEF